MCMLFAVSAAESIEVNDYLKKFYANSAKHPHGWGLAYLRGDTTVIKKECVEASKSQKLADALKKPLRSRLVLAHIRYATIGNVDNENVHPFSHHDANHKRWTLIHNGTIFDYPALSRYVKKQKGETDSERIFLYFLDELNRLKPSSEEERFSLFEKIISEMSRGNKLNLIFTDGDTIYVHTNCRDTLFYLQKNGSVIFSTTPLDGDRWKKVPFCTLLAYRCGSLIKEGIPHYNEYTENSENVRMLYRIFSNL